MGQSDEKLEHLRFQKAWDDASDHSRGLGFPFSIGVRGVNELNALMNLL